MGINRKDFFCKKIPKYRKDITLFAKEVLSFTPDDWQKDVFDSIVHRKVRPGCWKDWHRGSCRAVVSVLFSLSQSGLHSPDTAAAA